MAETATLPHSARRNEQLATPLLTPVAEEFPDDYYGSLNLENRKSPDSDQDVPLPPISQGAATDSRNRSVSLPHRHALDAPLLDSSRYSQRPSAEAPSVAKQAARRDVLKLSSAQIQELTSAPDSLPVRSTSFSEHEQTKPRLNRFLSSEKHESQVNGHIEDDVFQYDHESEDKLDHVIRQRNRAGPAPLETRNINDAGDHGNLSVISKGTPIAEIPPWNPSTPKNQTDIDIERQDNGKSIATRKPSNPTTSASLDPGPSPMPDSLPLPPFSMPTYLHLELASERPSPLYIHRSAASDVLYEPTSVKFERLLNFLLLPPQLERVLLFGALTCLDAWLYTFTILPLRFLKAVWMVIEWAALSFWREVCFLASFVYSGLGRLWLRRLNVDRRDSTSANSSRRTSDATSALETAASDEKQSMNQVNGALSASHGQRYGSGKHHRRRRSMPSLLQPNHKADLLQGALIIASCMILLKFDASRMYHSIRGQAAIKLYVIYNVLEVFDRLFSALGQDIIECLFSAETLERKPNGRSKIIKPFWMFLLALIYTVIHATAFFYQVITLNVAVNSYSNALLTLLMSNQFVEIKGTVFKKFEKENLFQLTCADVVERFQLWLMLVIIALRNIVELGGLSVGSGDATGPSSSGSPSGNTTSNSSFGPFSMLPNAFTILPSLFPAQVLGPFLLVLGSEMLVDWLKHAYITKFNATSPALYGRFFDVLAKDYYSNAFATQNLVRRLGLPTIPLACLFIRAILQTYHMFLATTISSPSIGLSASSSLTLNADPTASPALAQIDHIFRNALGRSSFGGGNKTTPGWLSWSLDDVIALTTMLVFFLALYLLLLAAKLILGMILLSVARKRYLGMKKRERERVVETKGKRYGAWGTVEVGEDRRRWIYDGDPEGLKALKDKEARARDKEKDAKEKGKADRLENVDRYRMVAKRIW